MESKAFHICPFCQSPSPVSVSRCVRCDRSLEGLPLPVYGSDVDATPMRTAPGDLVDLPLRDGAVETPRREAVLARREPPVATPVATRRRRRSRLGMMAVGAAIVGAAVVGGWLVRAQDRGEPEPPAVTVPAAVPPATIAPTPAPVALPSARATVPATSARVRPVSSPASVAPAKAPAAPAPWTVRRAASRDEPARGATPAPAPDAEPQVTTVHPDVAAAPIDVERARDEDEQEPPEPPGVRVRPALRARLDRALENRDAVAERVRDLRARANVPVIRDVDEYQGLQQELAAALDELDRADAQVRRLQRGLRRE
jgi:hypothetical protein